MIFTIAIEPDVRLIERLTFLQEDLGKIITARKAIARWCRPEHMHLPLLCLGTHDSGAIPEFNEVLRNLTQNIAPFSITVVGMRAYPTPECPRLIQVLAQPENLLESVREQLIEAFRAAGIRCDDRPYHPSMLLGRVATRETRIQITDAMNAIMDLNFGQSKIFELALIGSELSETKTSHQIISRHFFRAES